MTAAVSGTAVAQVDEELTPSTAVTIEPSSGDAVAASGTLPYNPALDGIRGLAVAAVMLFHQGFSWARGGYLGVSTFFTLSGFLITSLLIAEHRRTGRISLTAFWARRLRRLLPAAVVALALISLSALLVNEAWERSLQSEVRAALLNFANWHFLLGDRPYAALFDPSATSPVLHFWSLAIEEQFYWVFPLVTVGLLWLARGRLWAYGAVLGGLVAVVAVVSRWPERVGLDRLGDDTIYYATPIRMAEILMGAVLAVVMASGAGRLWQPSGAPDDGSNGQSGTRSSRLAPLLVATLLGVAALAASAWAWWNVEQGSPLLYRGGLVAYALVSAVLVLAACMPGPVRALLSFEPLRLLGVVSYGVYLIHWPVFVILNEERVDQLLPFGIEARGLTLFAIRLVPTLLLAFLSYRLLERPIRRGYWPAPLSLNRRGGEAATGVQRRRGGALAGLGRAQAVALAGVAGVLLATVAVPRLSSPPLDQFEQIAEAQSRQEERRAALPPDVPRLLFFGDSSALTVSAGIDAWGIDNGRTAVPGHVVELGCGVGRGGQRRHHGEVTDVPTNKCDWERWVDEVEAHPEARAAVLLTGTWDIVDRMLPGDSQWRAPGDPVYDEFLHRELAGATELLRQQGLTVVWLTTPTLDFGRDGRTGPGPLDRDARVARLNEIVRQVVAQHDGVELVDLAGWFADLPPGEDERLRPDGVHLTLGTAPEVAEWLGPQILHTANLE